MTEYSIPVDLFNPGQVFACVGFLEAAEKLAGPVEGCFDWIDESNTKFHIRTSCESNPFETVLENFVSGSLEDIYPKGWPDCEAGSEIFPSPLNFHRSGKKLSDTKLPSVVKIGYRTESLTSWADGSTRPEFKLYSGNRSGTSIASGMLFGKRKKPNKSNPRGAVENDGVEQLFERNRDQVILDPLNSLCSMAGSFNLDPRGAWNSMDAGYSPNDQKHSVAASPLVEFFACFALENFRPKPTEDRDYGYAVWSDFLPVSLARPTAAGHLAVFPTRQFEFELALSGKNKLVTFSYEIN